jgi:IS30 family transposase
MERRYGRGFSTAEKTEMWDRWQRGETMRSIGRVFCKPSSSIYSQLAPLGGIRSRPRCRSRLALTSSDREEISRGTVAQCSIRSASMVSREVRRNGGYDRYRAAAADAKAWVRATARSVVSWRTAHGYGVQWRGISD